ncbi:uncharacterized protein N0V89_010052 [Didymosphaeria variabile]|uniref:Uncharacterized protein n=1 Tax=Didymosphaeria variabile TaxID=1932322 RepID=A0A9W9C8Q5_9PLEO|nr:uncharacterized protein N0V89_010052 [Didymosphaeria variabile]KAJ4348674.1 hypothetical protein N0V89_010052 [Didymosphaeria variabile]
MNTFASQNNDELFLILAIFGFCGVISLIGTFAASIYIEKLSANDDSDVEAQNGWVTRSELRHLQHWVASTVDKSMQMNADHMKLQREKMEEYVRERLGYGTFTPRGGTPIGTPVSASTTEARVKKQRRKA